MTVQYQNPMGAQYYDSIRKSLDASERTEDENFFVKSLTSQTATAGSEFIPEGYSANIIMELHEQNWARQLFGTWVVSQGTKENIPKFSTKLTEASGNVSSALDALPTELTSTTSIQKADYTTTEVEIELKTLAIRLEIQNKFLAYNVNPQIESMIRQDIADTMASAEENMFVNGDTETSSASNINYTYNSSSHTNGVNTASGDNEELLLFDGIRNSATGTAVDASSAAFDEADFRTALKNIGIFARKGLDKLTFLVSPDLHSAMLGFTGIHTIDKYGPKAGIVTGEVFKIYGIRVVVTDKMPNTASATLTDSSGVRAASGNSYTEFALIYNPTVIIGVPNNRERTFSIKKKEWPEFDRVDLIAREDVGIAFKWTGAIVRGYNGTA